MKKALFIFSFILASTFYINAQSSLMANYPLTENGVDVSGQNDSLTLKNVIFQNGGAYSNGIYAGNDTTGSEIMTPPFTTFDYDNFTVYLDFKIEAYPENREPIIIGGYLWRWIGAYVDGDKLAFMANDFSLYEITDKSIPLNQWNKLRISFKKEDDKCSLFLNDSLVSDYTILEFSSGDDPRFVNYHGGSGITFKGYWRNLVFYNSSNPEGIDEISPFENISVSYSNEYLSVNVPGRSGNIVMDIFDVQGSMLKTAWLSKGVNRFTLNLREGVYMLRFKNDKGVGSVKKIMITN